MIKYRKNGRKEMENKVPVQKNKEYIVTISDYGYEGEGIAKIDNFTIFIQGAMKGEKVKILIVKVNTSHAFRKSYRNNKCI